MRTYIVHQEECSGHSLIFDTMLDAAYMQDSAGNASSFFDNVADDVHWTVMGTHPLAGVYKSKEDFLKNTFERLDKVLAYNVCSLQSRS